MCTILLILYLTPCPYQLVCAEGGYCGGGNHVMARMGYWKFPSSTQVIFVPCLYVDGSIALFGFLYHVAGVITSLCFGVLMGALDFVLCRNRKACLGALPDMSNCLPGDTADVSAMCGLKAGCATGYPSCLSLLFLLLSLA